MSRRVFIHSIRIYLVSMLKFMHEWLYTTQRWYVPNYTANVCASPRRPHNIVTSQLQRRYCEGISPFSPLTRIKAWTLTFYVFFNVSLCKEYFYAPFLVLLCNENVDKYIISFLHFLCLCKIQIEHKRTKLNTVFFIEMILSIWYKTKNSFMRCK